MALQFNPDDFRVLVTNGAGQPIVIQSRLSGTVHLVRGRSYGGATGQVAANSNVVSHQVGPTDALFRVGANVLVTTATTHAFNVEVAYTDVGGSARVLILPFVLVAGAAIVVSVANATGTVPYHGLEAFIKAKAGTTITLRTQAAGTYTAVVYNIDGFIEQVQPV